MPSFAGQGGTLWVETEQPLSAEEAESFLAASPGIEVTHESEEASTRERVGSDSIRIARLRNDPAAPDPQCSLMFWVAADPVRLAAQNAVKLLRARLSLA